MFPVVPRRAPILEKGVEKEVSKKSLRSLTPDLTFCSDRELQAIRCGLGFYRSGLFTQEECPLSTGVRIPVGTPTFQGPQF